MLLELPQYMINKIRSRESVLETPCWEWTGALSNGYAHTQIDGKAIKAATAIYELLIGPVPKGMVLDHICHTKDATCRSWVDCKHRRCVNPTHLEPVTQRENVLRGRGISAHNAVKTHCEHGHEFTFENTRICADGSRACRICQWRSNRKRGPAKAAWLRRYRERNKGA